MAAQKRFEPACAYCGRPIKAWKSEHGGGRKTVKRPAPDHDLCQRCWQGEQDRNQRQFRSVMVREPWRSCECS